MKKQIDDSRELEEMLNGEPRKIEPIKPPFINSSKRNYDKGYEKLFGEDE